MKVIVYLATLPGGAHSTKSQRKVQSLTNFAEGARRVGDTVEISTERKFKPCDVAVMLGWVHERGKRAAHLSFRQEIIDQQRAGGQRIAIVDSNLFLYTDTENPLDYLRYSFDDVFPGRGEYCDQHPDPSRWLSLSKSLNIVPKPWRTNGNHILLCLQRNGGWSMGGYAVKDWTMHVISQLREKTSRPVILRTHPKDGSASTYIRDIIKTCSKQGYSNISVSEPGRPLVADLKNCWAVVNHNSSPAVAAAIEGIPVFATDPALSQAREVANRNLDLIENPKMPERDTWLQRLAQFHWNRDEVVTGQCWNHMRQWVKESA